jgi:CRP-like cAMP-binding protein
MSRRQSADPNSARVAAFGPGTIIGEMEMLSEGSRRDFLLADSEAEVAEFSRERLADLKIHHPEVASRLFASISVELATRLKFALDTISSLE